MVLKTSKFNRSSLLFLHMSVLEDKRIVLIFPINPVGSYSLVRVSKPWFEFKFSEESFTHIYTFRLDYSRISILSKKKSNIFF